MRRFEWDPAKAAHNLAKHGVPFEEAQTAFDDGLFLAFEDPNHSEGERRYLLMGQSSRGRLLVVSYTGAARQDSRDQRPGSNPPRAQSL